MKKASNNQGLELLNTFLTELRNDEKSKATIDAYERDIKQYLTFTGDKDISLQATLDYKDHLKETGKPSSINRKLIAINKFLKWAGKEEAKVKLLKIQKRSSLDNVITLSDYNRILRYAEKLGYTKYLYLMKTLAYTGIRIGELQYITLEAVKAGEAIIENKGKIREIPIAKTLRKLLVAYCKEEGITSGIVFRTKNNTPVKKEQFFRVLKKIAGQARVNLSKVHPHAFRHLFAITFLSDSNNNITELADILGHSSLETTRIYTRTTTKDKANKIDRMKF